MNRKWAITGVALTVGAWGCWQGMETVPDYSQTSTTLFYTGNVLIALALYAFYRTFRSSKS